MIGGSVTQYGASQSVVNPRRALLDAGGGINVRIIGGTVRDTSNSNNVAISATNVYIDGGTVIAEGVAGTAITTDTNAAAANVTINSGRVSATASDGRAITNGAGTTTVSNIAIVESTIRFDQHYTGAPPAATAVTGAGGRLTSADIPTPTRSGYTFDGWFTSTTGGELANDLTTRQFLRSNTFYARWTPLLTFSKSATPAAPAFGSHQFGYAQRPAQTITITNTGTGSITLNALPSVPNWTLVQGVNWSTPLAAGQTRTFTIRPNDFLSAGIYNPVITITGSGGTSVQIRPTFTVTTIPFIESFIARLYQNVLGRTPEPTGYAEWSNALRNGAPGSTLAYGFFFSPEFIVRNHSNEVFVDILYLTLFDRSADASGKAAWVDLLNQGLPREDAFAGFVNSPEFGILCDRASIVQGTYTAPVGGMARVFAARLFSVTLQRAPDSAGLNDWHAALVAGASGIQVARGFMFSQEMNARNLNNADFVEILYNAKMGRPSDPAGKASWVSLLNNGVSREAVFLGFANSVEFEHICRTHGIQR